MKEKSSAVRTDKTFLEKVEGITNRASD